MALSKRLYHVAEQVPGPTPDAPSVTRHHLVRATSQAAAIRAVAAPRFTAEVPDAESLVRLTIDGVRIVEAGDAE